MRLRKLVDHMVTRLQQPDGRLYASVVDNIVDLIQVLPDLNLTNDPALNAFADEIRTRLCAASVKELKGNDLLRAATAQEAAEIATRLAAHMEYGADSVPVGTEADGQTPTGSSDAADQIFSQMAAYFVAP